MGVENNTNLVKLEMELEVSLAITIKILNKARNNILEKQHKYTKTK